MYPVLVFILILVIIALIVSGLRRGGKSRQGPDGIPPDELTGLQDEVRNLRELVDTLNNRLTALEREQRLTSASHPEQTQETQPAAAIPGQKAAPVVEQWESPLTQQPVSPASEAAPPKPLVPQEPTEWEQIIGGNWLARIGALALVIGVGFFLKFAFDNNWIGPTGRIVLGIIGGLILLLGGHFWRKKYPTLAQALSGAGIGILYLSVFAAYAVYSLMSFFATFGFLLLVSVASAGLALLYNSMALAVIGILGAFIAPTLLKVSPAGAGAAVINQSEQTFWLLAYVVVVDIGVLVLSAFRNWRWFTLLAMLGSLSIFGMWYDGIGYRLSLSSTLGWLTGIFLIFVAATTLFHIVWRRTAQPFDEIVMTANAAAYFGISYGLLWGDHRVWLGGFSVLLAVLYGLLAYAVLKRGAENVNLSYFALSIALIFLTVAVPVQLGDRAWTTIAWAAEGAVLVWLSFTLRLPLLRYYSYAIFFITAGRLFFFDQLVYLPTYKPILNERFLAFAVSIAAFYLAGYFIHQKREMIAETEKQVLSIYPIFFVAANFFTVWVLSAEVVNYFDTSLALTALWAIYAVALLVVGMIRRWRSVRLWALALLAIPILKVFLWDVFTLKQLYRIIAFVGLGILLLVMAYLYHRYSERIRGFIAKQ